MTMQQRQEDTVLTQGDKGTKRHGGNGEIRTSYQLCSQPQPLSTPDFCDQMSVLSKGKDKGKGGLRI